MFLKCHLHFICSQTHPGDLHIHNGTAVSLKRSFGFFIASLVLFSVSFTGSVSEGPSPPERGERRHAEEIYGISAVKQKQVSGDVSCWIVMMCSLAPDWFTHLGYRRCVLQSAVVPSAVGGFPKLAHITLQLKACFVLLASGYPSAFLKTAAARSTSAPVRHLVSQLNAQV